MKKLLSLFALTLVLASCTGGPQTVRFRMTFDTQDATRKTELTEAAKRVIQGRLLSQKKQVIKEDVLQEGDTAVITVQVPDADAAKILKDGLTSPFSMEILKEVGKGQGDIVSAKYGEFKETGITTKHFDWVAAGAASTGGGSAKGSVTIAFTPAGQVLLKDVFGKNVGSVIGIFVRGLLMSKKTVNKSDNPAVITIDGIPNAGLAAAFADDANVGLHVTFTQLQ